LEHRTTFCGTKVEKRIKNSLCNTELDNPSIRVGGYRNSKIPTLKGWTKGALEKKTIGEILSSPETYNYSIRTGELLGQNTHLIVIDIDLNPWCGIGTHFQGEGWNTQDYSRQVVVDFQRLLHCKDTFRRVSYLFESNE
jgi:hypothetical protein